MHLYFHWLLETLMLWNYEDLKICSRFIPCLNEITSPKWFILYKVTIKFGLMLVTPNKVEQGTSREILQILQVKKAICSGRVVPPPFVIARPYCVYPEHIVSFTYNICRISLLVPCSTLFGFTNMSPNFIVTLYEMNRFWASDFIQIRNKP